MVLQRIKEIIAEQLGITDDSLITPTTSLVKDLEADSLDIVEITLAIEEEYDIEIPDETAEVVMLGVVEDIVRYVEDAM